MASKGPSHSRGPHSNKPASSAGRGGDSSSHRKDAAKASFSSRRLSAPALTTQAPKATTFEGIISISARGTGYLAWGGETDIEIPTGKLAPALNGDTVEVRTTTYAEGRMQGEVIKVIERNKEEFVGTVTEVNGNAILATDDRRIYLPFHLEGTIPKAGTKILATLTGWKKTGPVGVVSEVIGTSGEHRTEMNAIVLEHGFKTTFPPEVLQEAREIEKNHAQTIEGEAARALAPDSENPGGERLDYREVTTMTIDPVDAKDFDDALSLRQFPDGTLEVGVHIADVTYFVRPGSMLEEEAKKRATSIYLVDATIPMLPLELSGNVCSLRPDEDRLSFAALFKMKKDGTILSRRFARTIIRSNKRFTYEEAQAVLDTGTGVLRDELFVLRDLARKLKAARAKEGSIEFDQDEVKFVLDDNGKPLRVVRKVRIETNTLIEDFMLLANREVAHYVSELAAKVPDRRLSFLYRIHDVPKEDRIEELSIYLRAIGYELKKPGKGRLTARDINELFDQIKGKPEEQLIKTATIRSMAKAIYSTRNIGHFGLSFEYYTHFTSPIRRYPDMLVHRVLASHVGGTPLSNEEFGNLERLCIHSSEQEAKAVSAERDSIRYKQVEFMTPRIGETFDAIVSGVADWGIYVEEKETKADGLVRVRSLKGDYFVNDKKTFSMMGQKTGTKFSLGDPVKVKLIAADLSTRTLEFALA